MLITGYNAVLFSALSAKARTVAYGTQGRFPILNTRLDNAPAYAGTQVDAATLTVEFIVNTGAVVETTLLTILGTINPDDPTLRLLTGTAGGASWETPAAVGSWRYVNVNAIQIDFVVPAGGWRKVAATVSSTQTMTANTTHAFSNSGYRVARPSFDIAWPGTTNRASGSSTTGFKYMRRVTLKNNGDRTVENMPWQIGPWDTATLVTAGKMLANGDDLRIFRNGRQIRRNLIAMNWPLTFIWFVPDSLPPGVTHTYEFVYGNSAATSPKTLTFSTEPAIPAFSITGDTIAPTSSTTTYVIQTGKTWEVDQWAGATIVSTDGQYRKVLSNTATTIFVTRAWSSSPSGGDKLTVTKSGLKGDGGIVTAATATTLSDTVRTGIGPTFIDNEWTGGTVLITSGTGSGQVRTIGSNTSQSVTVTSSWATTPDTTSRYRLSARNRYWNYDVRQISRATAARGLWNINKGKTRPSQIRFDAPGTWYRGLYLRNSDAFSQPRAANVDVGGGDIDWFSLMRIQRAREGKSGTQTEVGVADSVVVASPFSFYTFRGDVRFRNAAKSGAIGMCRMLFGTQESGGEEWSISFDYGVAFDTSTTVIMDSDLVAQGNPLRLMITLIPQDGDAVPDTDNNTALLETSGNYWALDVNPEILVMDDVTDIAYEAACYDLELSLRLGGGVAGTTYPHKRIDIGGVDRKLLLAATQKIRVNTDARTAEILAADGTRLSRIGHLIRSYDVLASPSGGAIERIASDWMPAALGANTIYVTDSSGAGWGSITLQSTVIETGYF